MKNTLMHPDDSISRRKFIQQSTVLGGTFVLSPLFSSADVNVNTGTLLKAYWYHQPLRILQTVLREPDAKDYDAHAVVRYMEKTSCNTLVVNAGGIVDFFQNPLPAANINSFMGTRDILKEITTACQAAGIRVIGRIDFRGVEEKIFKQHPDWFSLNAELKPLQLSYTRPQLYAGCYTGYYRTKHAEEFIRHLMTNYGLDGIWHNSIGVTGICYCPSCQRSYKTSSGKSIPLASASKEELDQYMNWKALVADEHMKHMKRVVKSFGDDKVYTAEVFSMFESGSQINSGIDLYNARDHFDFLVSVAFLTENTDHIHYEDLTYANTIVRFLKSMAPEKEAIILYGENGTSHRYVMDPPIDLNVWLWEALTAGGHFWNCSFTGAFPDATYDRRNAYNHKEVYQFVKDNEKYLTLNVPVANVGVYYSRHTRLFYRTKQLEGDDFGASMRGVIDVLMENHIPYDFIPDDQLSAGRIEKYKLIILPNVKCMSDNEITLLKDFTANGGTLLATYESSLFHEDGKSRNDFGLTELFGCQFTGEKVNTRKDCYQFILEPDHPLVKEDSKATSLLINAGHTLLCKTTNGKKICTYVPVVHNQPPEKAWTTEWAREYPTVVENNYKHGKVIYFANQPDFISHEFGHPDARNLLKRSIQYLAGDSLPIETNAPASVHVGLTKSPEGYLLSLVNTTSGPVRPLRNLAHVYDIEVKLRLPRGMNNYTVLRTAGKYSVINEDGQVVVRVEKLEDFFGVNINV